MTVTRIAGILLLATAGAAFGQVPENNMAGPRFSFGYVANAPYMFLGGSAQVLFPIAGGLGLYVDAKFDHDSPANWSRLVPGLTAAEARAQYPDLEYRRHRSWRNFNGALMRPVTREFVAYAGGGVSRERIFMEFYDFAEQRGEFGFYVAEDVEETADHVNLIAGGLIRITRFISFHVGGELAPPSFIIGVNVGFGGGR